MEMMQDVKTGIFYPGFEIYPLYDPMGFIYGDGVKSPIPENRSLDSIRASLLDPDCSGPETVYSIAMDVGKLCDMLEMKERNLLYGAVTYSKGLLGNETVRSQGHIHAVSSSCGMSTCEVYEIWKGSAYIYMQESGNDDPGRCFAVYGEPGDVIIVPPGWVHAAITADPEENMTFGAWCVRDYGFEYADVRRHKGIAWFYICDNGQKKFVRNEHYRQAADIVVKKPRKYTEFGIEDGIPVYTQFEKDPDRFLFVSKPQTVIELWKHFEP